MSPKGFIICSSALKFLCKTPPIIILMQKPRDEKLTASFITLVSLSSFEVHLGPFDHTCIKY